jgi:magnesium chelatase family protein
VRRYRGRVSGPLLDRIDLHIEVPPVEVEALERGGGEGSAAVSARVSAARERALDRFRRHLPDPEPVGPVNASLTSAQLRRLPSPAEEARTLMARAVRGYHLTARTWHRLYKVAWTIADLAGDDAIGPDHVSEALHYRTGERMSPSVHRA